MSFDERTDSLSGNFAQNAKLDAITERKIYEQSIGGRGVQRMIEAFEKLHQQDEALIAEHIRREVDDTRAARERTLFENECERRRAPAPRLGLGASPPLPPAQVKEAREAAAQSLERDDAQKRRNIRIAVYEKSNPEIKALDEKAKTIRAMAERFNEKARGDKSPARGRGEERGDE